MIAKTLMALILAVFCIVVQAQAVDAEVADLHQLVTDKAQNNNVPTELAHAVVSVESGYNPRAFNQGSYGIAQIKCGTARGLGFTGACRRLFDPEENLTWAMLYLRAALDQAGDNYCHALTLYNQGLGTRATKGRYCRTVISRIEN
jgi:soluble lytic murein transglycosylase-like protein